MDCEEFDMYLIYDSTGDETVERRRNQETQVVYGTVYGTVHAEKLLAFPIWRNRNLTMQSQSGDAIAIWPWRRNNRCNNIGHCVTTCNYT